MRPCEGGKHVAQAWELANSARSRVLFLGREIKDQVRNYKRFGCRMEECYVFIGEARKVAVLDLSSTSVSINIAKVCY
jgi:hypothetical protein